MPGVWNDRPVCTLTLTQLPAAYSVSLNGLSCQSDGPSEIFNIQPEVYQAAVCQMASRGFTLVLLQLSLPLSLLSHLRYGRALCGSSGLFHLYINNTLRRVNENIYSTDSGANIIFLELRFIAHELQKSRAPPHGLTSSSFHRAEIVSIWESDRTELSSIYYRRDSDASQQRRNRHICRMKCWYFTFLQICYVCTFHVQVTREDEDGDGQARHVHVTCLYRGGGARGENDSGRVSFNICKSRTTRYF